MVWDALGAKLHPGIGLRRTEDLEFQVQLKILVLARRAEKLVVRDFFRETPGNDRAVLDSEKVHVAFPAGKRFAVED